MIVLRVMLDQDAFWTGMPIEKLATRCRDFLLSHPVLRNDLPPTKQFPNHATASVEQWSAWWLEWPLSRWMGVQSGRWFKQEEGMFVTAFNCPAESRADFESLTSELVEYRLAQRPERESTTSFTAKVTHSGGRPILMLPSVEQMSGRPFGPIEVKLPDGSIWVFRLVRIACNVAGPKGKDGNKLGALMHEWFGPDAGMPGTGFRVEFKHSTEGWSVAPVEAPSAAKPFAQKILANAIRPIEIIQSPEMSERYTRFVVVEVPENL